MKTTGSNMMGFNDPDDVPTQPNRAARRAALKRSRSAQRRGQRAFERALRNGDGTVTARVKGDVAAVEGLR